MGSYQVLQRSGDAGSRTLDASECGESIDALINVTWPVRYQSPMAVAQTMATKRFPSVKEFGGPGRLARIRARVGGVRRYAEIGNILLALSVPTGNTQSNRENSAAGHHQIHERQGYTVQSKWTTWKTSSLQGSRRTAPSPDMSCKISSRGSGKVGDTACLDVVGVNGEPSRMMIQA